MNGSPEATQMKKAIRTAALGCAAVLALSGCASATFQFVSDPEGAEIRTTAGGSAIGTAPFSFTADADSLRNYATTPGCYRLPYGYEAKWASGATETTEDPINICAQPGDRNPVFTFRFTRPKDAPGLETDLQAALKNAQARAAREAARAAALEDQMMWDGWGWGPFWGPMWVAPPRGRWHRPPPPPPPRMRGPRRR